MAVWRMLQELNYRPFRPRLIHALHDGDADRRVEFCEFFLDMVDEDESLLDRVYWSDEASFKLNGHINRHNCVYWAEENPHVTIDREVNLLGVNVWCAISSQGIIGPHFFDGTVNSQSYLALLKETLLPEIRRRNDDEDVYFQQDGAPPHYAQAVRDWLDENFPGRWIGRRGPIEWPARSPDLTPPDFFLWGVVKDIVYANKPRTVEDLKDEMPWVEYHWSYVRKYAAQCLRDCKNAWTSAVPRRNCFEQPNIMNKKLEYLRYKMK